MVAEKTAKNFRGLLSFLHPVCDKRVVMLRTRHECMGLYDKIKCKSLFNGLWHCTQCTELLFLERDCIFTLCGNMLMFL